MVLMVTLSPFIYLHSGSVLSYRMKKVKSSAILLPLFFHSRSLPLLVFFRSRTGDGLARVRRVGEEVSRLPSSDGFLGSILLHRAWWIWEPWPWPTTRPTVFPRSLGSEGPREGTRGTIGFLAPANLCIGGSKADSPSERTCISSWNNTGTTDRGSCPNDSDSRWEVCNRNTTNVSTS